MQKLNSIFPLILFLLLGLAWQTQGYNSPAAVPGLRQDASVTPQVASVTPTLTPTATLTITVTPTKGPTATLTPLPEEYVENPDQTTGIIFGAVFLLIIIVGGTFFTLRSNK